MPVEVKRGAVLRERTGGPAAQHACDVDIKHIAAVGGEPAEKSRQPALRFRVGRYVELFTVQRREKFWPAIAVGGGAIDQQRAAEDDDLATMRGQPVDGLRDLLLEKRAALRKIGHRGGPVADIARRKAF